MTNIIRSLFAVVLLLTLIMPAGSALAGDRRAKAVYFMISTTHKRAPQIINQDLKPAELAAPDNVGLPVISEADAKQRPAQETAPVYWPLHNKLSARSAIIMDALTGDIVFAKQPDLPGQPASTIKVLTSLVAIQSLQDDELVPVSKRAAQMPRSKIYLSQKKSYNAGDLINAVLLASANDASVALAEKIAGSESSFAQLMTQKAKELGAQSTVCKTASGLTSKGQFTTARDLAIIFNQAMKNREFANRVGQIKAKTSDGKILRNHNKALWQISGNEGGKTGYTVAARQTYVGKFSRDRREILVAIMGSRTMWQDIGRLVEYAFSGNMTMAAAGSEAQPEQASQASDSADRLSMLVIKDSKKVAKL